MHFSERLLWVFVDWMAPPRSFRDALDRFDNPAHHAGGVKLRILGNELPDAAE